MTAPEIPDMQLDIIENNGPDNLRDTLKARLRHASEVSIAVAFVTQAGLDEIIQPLRQVAATGRVRLLTGLYQKVTEPQALRSLLRIQRESAGSFLVRLSREPKFHRKLYRLTTRTHSTVILGSSNLTREGLRSGGEINLIATFPKGALVAKKLTQAFEDDWDSRSVELTAEQIDAYEKVRPNAVQVENYTKAELTRILGAPPIHRAASEEAAKRSFWRDCVTGLVKQRTERLISETTDWDDKNYLWYCTGGAHRYKKGDHIFLFDFHDRRVRLVVVKDIARMKVTTPDGRHFVAYKSFPKLTRRFSKRLWASLKEAGIDPKKARNRRTLGAQKIEVLTGLLRPVKKRKTTPAAH